MMTYNENEIKSILEGTIIWPQSLQSMTRYRRTHDDCEGKLEQCICVMFGPDGDAYCSQDVASSEELNWDEKKMDEAGVLFPNSLVRFRTYHGGGRSERVHNALKILALAIVLDNQDDPRANPDAE